MMGWICMGIRNYDLNSGSGVEESLGVGSGET